MSYSFSSLCLVFILDNIKNSELLTPAPLTTSNCQGANVKLEISINPLTGRIYFERSGTNIYPECNVVLLNTSKAT